MHKDKRNMQYQTEAYNAIMLHLFTKTQFNFSFYNPYVMVSLVIYLLFFCRVIFFFIRITAQYSGANNGDC